MERAAARFRITKTGKSYVSEESLQQIVEHDSDFIQWRKKTAEMLSHANINPSSPWSKGDLEKILDEPLPPLLMKRPRYRRKPPSSYFAAMQEIMDLDMEKYCLEHGAFERVLFHALRGGAFSQYLLELRKLAKQTLDVNRRNLARGRQFASAELDRERSQARAALRSLALLIPRIAIGQPIDPKHRATLDALEELLMGKGPTVVVLPRRAQSE